MKMKAALLIAVVVGVSLVAGSAAWAVDCPATVGAWEAQTSGCTVTDKIFTFVETSGTGGGIPGGTGFSVSTPITGVHIITFNFATLAPGGILPQGDYVLEYKVQITAPLVSFVDVSMDATVPGQSAPGAVTVTKDIFNTTSTGSSCHPPSGNCLTSISTGGGPVPPSGLGSGVQLIDVFETFHVGAGGILTGTTNTYTQSNRVVPAPASLVLLGLGLTGVAFVSRKKKR